jgi:hypothetical protein
MAPKPARALAPTAQPTTRFGGPGHAYAPAGTGSACPVPERGCPEKAAKCDGHHSYWRGANLASDS